jgi:AbrB family looped-hinge helix DNA binding protein
MNAPKQSAVVSSPMRVRVSKTGRMSLPAEVRRAIGFDEGGILVLNVEDGVVRLRAVDRALDDARQKFRQIMGDEPVSVDDFLEFRRSDSEE